VNRAAKTVRAAAAGLAGLAAAAWLLGALLRDRDERYEGHTAYDWADLATNGTPELRARAPEIARTVIVPDLVRRILTDTNDSAAALWTAEALSRLPGLEVPRTAAEGRRNQAVQELALFGTNAAAAIPVLLAYVRATDEDLCGSAAEVLPRIGADAETLVPLLVARLTDEGGHGRAVIVDALEAYGPRAKAAVPALLKLVGDRSSKEIMRAVPNALKAIDPDAAARAGVR
jgi:HEAT repeat protein